MARVIVTKELAETIRGLRITNKVPSKEVADHIGKSPAYISKLESNNLHSIDANAFSALLQYITKENSDARAAEQIYNTLQIKYSQDDIDAQIWFTNYDTVMRKIPVPTDLIDKINDLLNNSEITLEYLTQRINANESLSQSDIKYAKVANQWYYRDRDENRFKRIIRMQISEDDIYCILNGSVDTSSYMYVFCILFYAIKISRFKDTIELSDDEYNDLYNETVTELNSHKFYSISIRNRLLREHNGDSNSQKISDVLSMFDLENSEHIEKILEHLRIASDYNVKTTNEQLKQLEKNLSWDLGFMLKLFSLDFDSLSGTSVSNRRELLTEIQNLIMKYGALPAKQNVIEEY